MKAVLWMVAGLLLLLPIPALATSDPSAPISISSIDAFEDTLETGDMLAIVAYNIPYTSTPTELASDTFIAKFMESTTTLQATAPYAYNERGYGQGILSFYFTAAEVTSLGISFNGATTYTVVLQGNPSSFARPPTVSSSVVTWNTGANPGTLVGNKVLSLFATLEATAAWSANGITLTQASSDPSAPVKLTTAGGIYGINAVPNLLTMAPQIFNTTSVQPVIRRDTFTQSQATTLRDSLDGTVFDIDPIADMFNTSDEVALTLFSILLSTVVAFIVMVALRGRDDAPAFGMASLGVTQPIFAFMGLGYLVFVTALASICVILVVWGLVLRNA